MARHGVGSRNCGALMCSTSKDSLQKILFFGINIRKYPMVVSTSLKQYIEAHTAVTLLFEVNSIYSILRFEFTSHLQIRFKSCKGE